MPVEEKKISFGYKIIRFFVKLFYPRMKVEGTEHLSDAPCIMVANHCQMNGPIACELYLSGPHYIWCAGQMMHAEDVAEYAFHDFWSQKPRWTHPFYRLVSHLITPLSVCIFQNAHTIGVYHDARILSTFKNTVKVLCGGANVVIFPEHDVKYNHIIYEFQDKYIDIARLYYKKTGKQLSFVPMYIAPKLKKMVIGQPVCFDPTASLELERSRISRYLMDSITDLACALPAHTVVPYRNIPKREYPNSKPEEMRYEKTRS